jgi:hypothetical protein
MNNKKRYILINAVVQAVFAMAFMCHRVPEVHWCAIAPIFACGSLLAMYFNDDEK